MTKEELRTQCEKVYETIEDTHILSAYNIDVLMLFAKRQQAVGLREAANVIHERGGLEWLHYNVASQKVLDEVEIVCEAKAKEREG